MQLQLYSRKKAVQQLMYRFSLSQPMSHLQAKQTMTTHRQSLQQMLQLLQHLEEASA